MSIRIQNSAKQVMKTSKATASISSGRSDMILLGNKVITVQKNGNETRSHAADSTLKEFADSVYAMLQSKNSPLLKKVHPFLTPYSVQWASKRKSKKADIYSPVYGINGMGIKDRLKQMEIMRQRKLGLID